MIILKYNQPVQVSRDQYAKMINRCAGLLAHRYDAETKTFWIKPWIKIQYCQTVLNS